MDEGLPRTVETQSMYVSRSICHLYSIRWVCLDEKARPVEPTKDQLRLAKDENFRLQSELENIHHKFEKLDTREQRFPLVFVFRPARYLRSRYATVGSVRGEQSSSQCNG